MKIKELVLASIAVTTFAAVTIAITQTGKESVSFNRVAATEKSFTFNEDVGAKYWNKNIYDVKSIASTAERGEIIAKSKSVAKFGSEAEYGVDSSFYRDAHSANSGSENSRLELAFGVNNLQSLSFAFHANLDNNYANDTRYTVSLKFYGEGCDLDQLLNETASDPLYQQTYTSTSVVKDTPYSEEWVKPDQNHVIRYALFTIRIDSNSLNNHSYCALFLENIGVTWNC